MNNATSRDEKSPAQVERDALLEWFENEAIQQEQQVAIVTYSGILNQLVDIYNLKNYDNGQCKFAELGKGVNTGEK